MKRLNVHQFYQLGRAIQDLFHAPIQEGTKIESIALTLMTTGLRLRQYRDYLPPLSRDAADRIVRAIDAVVPQQPEDSAKIEGKLISWSQAYAITGPLSGFVTILAAELPTLTTYIVDQKGAFSTPDIVERAEILFTEQIRSSLAEAAIADIRQAGRALAFDLPTAAGFHIVRAAESVVRKYYDIVVGDPPKKRDWGYYVEELKRHDADPRIVAAIDQMRSLDRNPLVHPEAVLSEDDALALFGIAQTTIIRIVMDIQARQKASGDASALVAPPTT